MLAAYTRRSYDLSDYDGCKELSLQPDKDQFKDLHWLPRWHSAPLLASLFVAHASRLADVALLASGRLLKS